ncbi:hypothetical protein STEG23_035558 [Scotinomys teguina]
MAAAPLPSPGPTVTRGRGQRRKLGSPKPGGRREHGAEPDVYDQSKGEGGGPNAASGQSKVREKWLARVKGASSEELESWALDWSPSQVVDGALLLNGPD